MPTIADICRAAKLDRDVYNTLVRSGRTAHWPDGQTKEFAIRIGLFAALRASGFLVPDAVAMAEDLARPGPPLLLFHGPLEGPEGTELRDYSGALHAAPLSELWHRLAADTGRQVIGDGPPVPDLDALPEADVLTVINVWAVIRRMEALFNEAEG